MANVVLPNPTADFTGYNDTGSTIPAFAALRITGAFDTGDGVHPTIDLTLSDDADTMPCAGITTDEIEDGQVGTVRTFGIIRSLDTSAFTDGDDLYVDDVTPGGLTPALTGSNKIRQHVGRVLIAHATEGILFVWLNPQMDGHTSYTIRDIFEIYSSSPTSALGMTASGGEIVVRATPTANRVIVLPDLSTTLVGKDTTDVLTNKAFDTAGAGNSLSINGVAATANTGTGAVVRATSPALTTPTIADFTNAQHDHGDADDGGQLAVGTAITTSTPGYSLKVSAGASPVPTWTPAGILFRREWQFLADPGAATGTRVGLLTAPTLTGAATGDDTVRPLLRHTSGSTSGNSAGVISGFDVTRSGWLSKTAFVYQTGGTITSSRWWCGWTTATLVAVATPTTQHVAAFSYDTGRDGTVFWRTVTCDGAAATVTATSVAFAGSTAYNLRIEMNGATNVLFYIDDVLAATHTTNLPSTAQLLGFQMTVTTLTAATRRFDWSRVGGETI